MRYVSTLVRIGVFAQVVADHCRHERVNRLVVGDAGADGIGQRYIAGAIGIDSPARRGCESERNASGSMKSSSIRR